MPDEHPERFISAADFARAEAEIIREFRLEAPQYVMYLSEEQREELWNWWQGNGRSFTEPASAPAPVRNNPDGEVRGNRVDYVGAENARRSIDLTELTDQVGSERPTRGDNQMKVFAVRSVALSAETADAWKAGGVVLARRGRTPEGQMDAAIANGHQAVLNLGNSAFNPAETLPVWNYGRDIRPLITPGATRDLLGDFMPPQPEANFPRQAWVKAPGAHGRGKFLETIDSPLVLPKSWDWCEHIDGQEYRLITVGHKLVQDFMRFGDNGNRSYEWIRMREVDADLKQMVREAATRVPGNNVIAWDTILDHDGTPYIFEGNTCPGVNADTVRRIVDEMERQSE